MSGSPPIRRLPTTVNREEQLINAYEAEEERIITTLSRKLEQLKDEKIDLENTLEQENEAHVNRLNRELSILRQQQSNGDKSSISSSSYAPSAEAVLETIRHENEQLRAHLHETEREFVRVKRLNEVYREELIMHRRRLGIDVGNLIGLDSLDPYSQPTHRRSTSNSSPGSSTLPLPMQRPSTGLPIPRPSSQVHRPTNDMSDTPSTPRSPDSPFPFSPNHNFSTSLASNQTTQTTPESDALSFNGPLVGMGTLPHALSYPTAPPPSLSSSFGSPTIPFHVPHREPPMSPVESLSRRSSRGGFRVAESGNLRSLSASRRESVERGARIAETGTLIRSRAGSYTQAGEGRPVLSGTGNQSAVEEAIDEEV